MVASDMETEDPTKKDENAEVPAETADPKPVDWNHKDVVHDDDDGYCD
jgi:hypothetical protein